MALRGYSGRNGVDKFSKVLFDSYELGRLAGLFSFSNVVRRSRISVDNFVILIILCIRIGTAPYPDRYRAYPDRYSTVSR